MARSFIFLSSLHHFVCDAFNMQTAKNELWKFVVVVVVRSCFLFFLVRFGILVRLHVSRERPPSILHFLGTVPLMGKLLNRFRFEFDVNVNKRWKAHKHTHPQYPEKWKTERNSSHWNVRRYTFHRSVRDYFFPFHSRQNGERRLCCGRETPLPLIVYNCLFAAMRSVYCVCVQGCDNRIIEIRRTLTSLSRHWFMSFVRLRIWRSSMCTLSPIPCTVRLCADSEEKEMKCDGFV